MTKIITSKIITKVYKPQKIYDRNYVQRIFHPKLLYKTQFKKKTTKKSEKEKRPRKEYLLNKNKNKIIIINFIIQILLLLIPFYFSNDITLKIKGDGIKKILSDPFPIDNYPQKIFINGKIQTNINNQYNFIQNENIVVLTWEHKITSSVKMFMECKDINEMDLSKFDASEIRDMNNMFAYCSSLTSINLSNLNTENVEYLYCKFRGCSSLTSIDVSSFCTNKVTNLHYMFDGCASLTSINLENFQTPLVDEAEYMFRDCINLEYINLKNFDGTHLNSNPNFHKDIFHNVPQNIVILANDAILGNYIKEQLGQIICLNRITNSSNWKSLQKKIINANGACVNKCSEDINNQYEYNGKCYSSCVNGHIIDENTQEKICKCELEKCLHCPPVALRFGLCTKCNEGYYQKENDNTNIGEYVNCYQLPEGYYLDLNDSLIKKCYISCLSCEIKGNNFTHNCIRCKETYSVEINFNGYLNCYERCSYFHYYGENKLYHCTSDYVCPGDYPYLIKGKNECTKNIDIEGIIDELGKNDTVLKYIEQYLTSEYYDTSSIDLGQDEVFKIQEVTYTITTINNQKKNKNTTTINLGLCELYLINSYNLNNKTLYIKKIEINEKGMKIPTIEYDVYARLNGTKLEKLDLLKCGNKITFSIPVELSGNFDELNSSSGYYNDLCYFATSKDGTDIILKDRQKEFINENKTVCQEDCDFVKYDKELKIALCSCQVKESSSSFFDMKINKAELYEAFIDIDNIMNINILKCYKVLLSINSFLYNIGSYIIILISFLHIIDIFIFFCVQFIKIKNQIKQILYIKKYNKINSQLYQEKEKIEKSKNGKTNINNNIDKNKTKDNCKKIILLKAENKFKMKKTKKKTKIKYLYKNINIINFNNNNKNKNSKFRKIAQSKKESLKKIKDIMTYIDEEINSLPFDLALHFDKRTFCQYYTSLLKTKHIFINSFIYNKDYNSKIIKIDLFFTEFTIFYTMNALFFTDKTMHKIYKGNFDFIYQLSITIYSSLISTVLTQPLEILALSNDEILDFKMDKNLANIIKRKDELNKKLIIKFVLYFVISFIF